MLFLPSILKSSAPDKRGSKLVFLTIVYKGGVYFVFTTILIKIRFTVMDNGLWAEKLTIDG
jgi:hypothetical protein